MAEIVFRNSPTKADVFHQILDKILQNQHSIALSENGGTHSPTLIGRTNLVSGRRSRELGLYLNQKTGEQTIKITNPKTGRVYYEIIQEAGVNAANRLKERQALIEDLRIYGTPEFIDRVLANNQLDFELPPSGAVLFYREEANPRITRRQTIADVVSSSCVVLPTLMPGEVILSSEVRHFPKKVFGR